MNSTKVSKRILALDILRGVTIAGMIMVNNPGSWGHIYAPLRHAEWNGLTPTDLVFPFFMFIMGISTYISLKKNNFEFSHAAGMKILKRTIVIFPYRHGYRLVLAVLLVLGLRSGRPQLRREAMGFRLDIRPYPYSGCHATAGPLLRSSLHHCTNHEA